MSRPVDVSVVIVNWNSKDFLRRCLESIVAHTRVVFEVIVIDSASYDGCAEMLRDEYPDVRFIQSDTNLGFARANNRAFEASRGDCVLFLNPDTELAGPAIDEMHAALGALPSAGVIGCRLLNADGSLQTSCIQAIPTIANQFLDCEPIRSRWPRSRLWGMAPLYDGTGPSDVEAVSGACLMIARGTFEAVGRFSEEYFMYAEDIDLCDKVRRAGYVNYFLPAARVVHYGGGSSERTGSTFTAVMLPEAIWRFLGRTRGDAYALGYRAAMLASAAARLALLAAAGAVQGRAPARAAVGASRRKWAAVLRWSVGMDPTVRQYYPVRPAPAQPDAVVARRETS